MVTGCYFLIASYNFDVCVFNCFVNSVDNCFVAFACNCFYVVVYNCFVAFVCNCFATFVCNCFIDTTDKAVHYHQNELWQHQESD